MTSCGVPVPESPVENCQIIAKLDPACNVFLSMAEGRVNGAVDKFHFQ